MRARVLGAVLSAAVLIGACGGEDGPPEIESKADFIAAGDEICADRDRLSLELAASEDKDNAPRLTRQLADIYAQAISDLRALQLPPGDARAGAAEYLESVEALATPVRQMRESADALAATRTPAAIKEAAADLESSVNTVTAVGDVADLKAREYGFERCGQQRVENPVA